MKTNDRGAEPATTVGAPTTVAIVGRNPDTSLLDSMLQADRYDVVIVESIDHAYSTIKQVAPQLVILGVDFDDAGSWQVLSMLKLDHDTAGIPVLTYFVQPLEHDSESSHQDVERLAWDRRVPASAN